MFQIEQYPIQGLLLPYIKRIQVNIINRKQQNRLSTQMETFRPFKAAVNRKQKYYSQKRFNLQMKGSIFNLPRQIITNSSIGVINPQITPKMQNYKQRDKFISEYHSNLKRTVRKHSIQMINRKALQKVVNLFIESDNRVSPQKIVRNRPSQMYTDKDMALKTLNILYRTIIQSRVKAKRRQKFELSAIKLPILQKKVNITKQTKIINDVKRNSSFDKYKLDLKTINEDNLKKGLHEYYGWQQTMTRRNSFVPQDQRSISFTRLNTLRRQNSQTKNMDDLVPWNQFNQVQQQYLY